MPPLLHNPTRIKHKYPIRMLHARQAVRNHDRRPVLRRRSNSPAYLALRIRVQLRGRFVEEQNLGIADERAGDGEALALAA